MVDLQEMTMNIDEMKDKFIDLLQANFNIYGKEDIWLNNQVLKEHNLTGKTFWDIVYPSLEKEGVLRPILDDIFPDGDPVENDPVIRSLRQEKIDIYNIYNGSPFLMENKLKTNEEKQEKRINELNENRMHKFLVDKEKLLRATTDGNKSSNELFTFTLIKDGCLSRRNPIGEDRPYKMEAKKLRHRIILELMKAQTKDENFYETKQLSEILYVTEGQVRKAIEGIKNQIEKSFTNIHRDDFIESSKNSGYRLHKQIKIIKL
jgi:hypothetical protein